MQLENFDMRRKKKQDACRSACLNTLLMAGIAGGLVAIWHYGALRGIAAVVVLLSALLELGAIVPIWISYKERIEEIEGGEEDAAAEY